eukprot:maker-scaffold192_size271026-snap-gene-0.15 protein:Tk07193 transcript:maker-scaffold192_size271026-snap-gene-0.15-mRNA-1 annotation:"denn domain-containing protein 5b"
MSEMSSSIFVRNFLICGLDVNSGLELVENGNGDTGSTSSGSTRSSWSSSSTSSDFNPMERSYQPKILRLMPKRDLGSNFNPDAMCQLIMPEGLRFCTDREIKNCPPKSHSFVVTKEDGEKVYGVALIFYELITDSNICHAVHTLQKMYSTEAEGGTLKRTDRMRPRSAKAPSERSRSLPRHYQQSRLSTSTLDLSSATYDYRKNTLHVTKAIALMCAEPLVEIAHQILVSMQKYICKSDFNIQVLEGLVSNLINDIPVPNNGRSVRFWCLGNKVTLSMPRLPLELPLYDFNLLDFFDMLGIENAIALFVCVLLEHQILVYSKDCDKLMLVCESITALLYPFAWQHVYVPILPPSLENFLDAPVPYIMGLLRWTHDMELSKKGCVCILDVDTRELEVPEEISQFPYQTEFIEEIRNTILAFGGRDGANVLKEHAIESRENLESSNSQTKMLDNSDTMEQLNQMINKFESLSDSKPALEVTPTVDRLKLNNALREVFVNRFVHMFLSYEHFVILGDESDMSLMPQQRETQQNFDKISFLSDQKQSHLPFLSSFLETQMFSTFIDECIDKMHLDTIFETPFELRLVALKDRYGDSLVRTPAYEPCDRIDISAQIMAKRLEKVELTITPQKSNQNASSTSAVNQQKSVIPGIFPLLDSSKFEGKSNTAKFVRGDRKSKSIDPGLLPSQKISMLNSSPAAIAETNWKFVNQLLGECKSKTKRILLEKLGQEAVEWGHGSQFSGSEENMLVASVCDLIERIWSHGFQNRQGKSSLWHFLYKFGRANEKMMRFKGALGKQAFYSPMIKSKPFLLPDHARPVQVVSNPLRKTPTFDSTLMAMVHNVSTIHEIKTDIGYARAWIRLALERKSLSQFLHVLASDPAILKNLYKRYAFLRSEDEREQSLYYLETLTTVEFSCFTNAYPNSSLLYQMLIFPSSKSGHTPCSSNVWIHVVGSYGDTSIIQIPRGVIYFSFWAKNLGVITSMRIGHDNSGSNPNWLIEHVLLRNEFTGQTFKFTGGRWLGQGVDDGSTERYLVGYPVPKDTNLTNLVQICAYPPEYTCPVTPIKSVDPENEIVELQVTMDFNHSLSTYMSNSPKSPLNSPKRGSNTLENPRRNSSLSNLLDSPKRSHVVSGGYTSTTPQGTMTRSGQIRRMYTKLVTRIETTCPRLGKDDKFQLFVCLAAYDKLLGKIVTDLTQTIAAQQLFEENSFMRKPNLSSFLSHIMEALEDISVPVDPAMKKTLEQHQFKAPRKGRN